MAEPMGRQDSGLRFSAWNLLLLLPFLMLVTPWINAAEPRLFGMPFFYWIQFAFVPVGVLSVAVGLLTTRHHPPPAPGAPAALGHQGAGTAGAGAVR